MWRNRARSIGELIASLKVGGSRCGACGFAGRPRRNAKVLWPDLINSWELTPEWVAYFDRREGDTCVRCGLNLRSGHLAGAIVEAVNTLTGGQGDTLDKLFDDPRAQQLSIAEVNSAGHLHRFLARCPQLRYSEYGSKEVPDENLMCLSYADGAFDLVVTSDTLEHVPDIDIALRETYRVLRPGGIHVFSVPVVSDRATRQRARFADGRLVHMLPPSHHGVPKSGETEFLVFYEFGSDFVSRCNAAGFEVTVLRDRTNPALVSFIARKPA